jgi:hypothetical protein
MRTVKVELNDQAEKLFLSLTSKAEFFGDTPRTLFVKLMMQYGKVGAASTSSAKEEQLLDGLTKEAWIEREVELRMDYIESSGQPEDFKVGMRKTALAMCKKRYELALEGTPAAPFGVIQQN